MDARIKPGAAPCGQATKETHSGSALSAEKVYHDYAPRVYSMARRMVASDLDAEDVTQDVLLQVVRKLPTFRGEAAFPTWLHRVTVNAALSHRRRQAARDTHGLRNSTDIQGEEEPLQAPGRVLPPDDLALTTETRQHIERAIRALPAAYRTVFVMADIEEMPNAEVAERLEMTLPAVKSRLHRARAMLRDALMPYFADVPARAGS
jgi:RNA polymerase sigma-70 factor, ECF subfamily